MRPHLWMLDDLFARRHRHVGIRQLDVEAERAHFLDEHVEAFRHARFERIVAAHDRLVDLGTAGHVVRLHGQHLLQRVGGAVRFERPHLHFAEALAAELRLAAQRLLGDERVRADRASMDLVVDKMVQLQHVLVADRDLAIERARPCVRRAGVTWPDVSKPASFSISTMSGSRAPSNTGVATGTPVFSLLGNRDQVFVLEARLDLVGTVDARHRIAQLLGLPALVELLRAPRRSHGPGRGRPSPCASPGSARRSCALGTPSGFSTTSTCVPSSRNGMSSQRHDRSTRRPCCRDGRPSCRPAGSCASRRRRP